VIAEIDSQDFLPSSGRLHMTEDPSRARLIGIVILTRFLKLPLIRYEAAVEKVEGSPLFTQLQSAISATPFPRAQVLEPGAILTPNTIGQLQKGKEGFYVSYRHPGLAREYLLDEDELRRWRQSQALLSEDEAMIQTLMRKLRLINTRNRLTHMILMGIAEHQGDYLASGDVHHLRPLSQVALTDWIRGEVQSGSRFLPPGSELELVEGSMISRLTRNMSVLTPQGQEIPLQDLLPSTRDVHKRLIETILEEEKEQIRQGVIRRVYTDEEIKEKLKERYGISISRRTVSTCRREMRIPPSYTRNSNHMYPPRLVRFSFHYPLNMASVKANAPEAPGVYEISLAETKIDYPLCPSGVVYIGSAKNLRKRLRDHLRPGSKNGDLKTLLGSHRAVFRYIVKHRGARAEEKRLCRCFILAHGSLPRCNRIKP